jgi:hypothetical protein
LTILDTKEIRSKEPNVSMESQNVSDALYGDRGRNYFLRVLSERKVVNLVKTL